LVSGPLATGAHSAKSRAQVRQIMTYSSGPERCAMSFA